MNEPKGPIDETIDEVLDRVFQDRDKDFRDLNKVQQEQFQRLCGEILIFVKKAGAFASDEKTIKSVYIKMLHALPAFADGLASSKSRNWLFSMLGRLQIATPYKSKTQNVWISPTGKLFLELRKRLKNRNAHEIPVERTFDKELADCAFIKTGRPTVCITAKEKTLPRHLQAIILCRLGCDATLLQKVGFPDVLAGRILSLTTQSLNSQREGCLKAISVKTQKKEHATSPQ